MKCPKCGCKMKKEIMCPYCKITGDQVRLASNQQAIERIKAKDTDEVYMSSTLPYDVSKKKMIAATVCGGWFGLHYYLVGRYKAAAIQSVVLLAAFLSFFFQYVIGITWLKYPTEALTLIYAIYVFLWLTAAVKSCFGIVKVPIVLPTKQEMEQRKSEIETKLAEKNIREENKKQAKYQKKVQKEKRKMERNKRK